MNTSKQFKTLILGCAFCTGITAAADFSTEASATIASQYLFRGFDLSQENPAVQGDFIVSHDSGFWFGVWGSSYDVGADDGIEVDFMAGYDIAISDDVSLGFGLTEYTYSGDTESSTEFYVSASFSVISIAYYNDIDLETGYFSVDAEFDLAESISLGLHAGNYNYDVGDSTSDYSITLNYSVNDKVALFVSFSSNDINQVGAEDYFVAGASFSF